MRTTTTQESKVLAAQERSNYLRVKTKSAAAVLTDLTALRGYNWVKSAEWSESVDNYVATATVELQRENELLSLANLVAASVLNSGGPLIEIGRELTIETATTPLGIAPGASDWHIVFHGYIDEVDWETTPIKVTCRDLAGLLLQDVQIQTERNYGTWEANRTLKLGYVQQPSGNPPNGQPATTPQYWRVTTAGITGGTEPAWPASPAPGATIADNTVVYTYQAAVAWTAGSSRAVGAFTANPTNTLQYWQCTAITTSITGGANPFPAAPTQGQVVTDGGVTWQYYSSLGGTPAETIIQQLIDDNLGAGVVSLVTPAASNWYLGPYTQSRDKLFNALASLSEAMGWDLRFAWNQAAGDYKLTLQSVVRTSPPVVWTFAASSYFDVTTLNRILTDIRNQVAVIFADAENVDGTTGQPTRATVSVSDATSIAKYGGGFNIPRAMEIAEDASSSIRTRAMATALANAALSDLKEPLANAALELPYFWALQLNDYVTFKANSIHADSDQSFAVVGLKHTFQVAGTNGAGTERTALTLRGLPTLGTQKHLDKEAGATSPLYTLKSPPAASGLVLTPIIAGLKISFVPPKVAGSKFLVPELHVSATPGFTPSSATLKDLGLKSAHMANDLTPGGSYVAAIVMRDQRGNVASKSAEQSFVAGYSGIGSLGASALNTLHPNLTGNCFAYLSGSATIATGATKTDAQILFNITSYDPLSMFNAGTSTLTLINAGKYEINMVADIFGVSAGDSAELFFTDGTSKFLGPVASAVTDPNGNDVLQLTSTFTIVTVSANNHFTFWLRSRSLSGALSWTARAPAGGPAGSERMGCYMRCSQQLA